MILAGDIGGTNTRLALYDGGEGAARFECTLPNRELPDFGTALARALEQAGRPTVSAAAFAVAGPVLGGHVEMTNLAWTLDETVIAGQLGGARVRLLNDLEAAAYGVLRLPSDDLRELAAGTAVRRGNVAVIGAGTGLGEALLAWSGDTPVGIASEGGHADFAPRDETEIALLAWLGRTRDHVSWEHVVSGPGIVWLYEFLRDSGRATEPPALRAALDAATDHAAVITRAGLAGEHPICVRVLEVFVRAYGAEAGNLALKGVARGGVYVTGGIAPSVLDGRWRDVFLHAFIDKGRYADFMRRIPVRVVVGENATLLGAHVVAAS
jgi:glucokinase